MARTRRANADRWIISLRPFFDVVADKASSLKIGEPRVTVGPVLMPKTVPSGKDKIRRGAVWFVAGNNVGFHVDFYPSGLHIEAWSGKDRQVSVWIAGEFTETTLKKDLSVVLVAAGLTGLRGTDEVRHLLAGRQ